MGNASWIMGISVLGFEVSLPIYECLAIYLGFEESPPTYGCLVVFLGFEVSPFTCKCLVVFMGLKGFPPFVDVWLFSGSGISFHMSFPVEVVKVC